MSLNIFSDVNVDDPNITTGNGAMELNVNATFGQGTEQDENEQNVSELCIFKNVFVLGLHKFVYILKMNVPKCWHRFVNNNNSFTSYTFCDATRFKHRTCFQVLTESVMVKPKFKTGCDNSVMFVKTSCCKSAKKLCCPFCDKLYSKLAKHMEVKHKIEPDVQRFLSFPKGIFFYFLCERLYQDLYYKLTVVIVYTLEKLNHES